MQKFLDAVRKAALPAIWSQGVKLAREGAAELVSSTAGEMVWRVRAPGHAIAPTVTLFTDDDEWSCDCDGKVDPCSHVTAAAIAAKDLGSASGAEKGAPAVAPPPSAK